MSAPTESFLAMIVPVAQPPGSGGGGGPVDPGYGRPTPPEMIWGGRPGDWVPRPPYYPAHPIAPGGPPYYPAHPIAPGGPPYYPAHPIAPGGPPYYPAHPIVPPGGYPGIWPDPGPLPPLGGGGPGGPPSGTPPPDPGTGGSWQWGFNLALGWHPVWVPGDKPQPVPPPTDGGSGSDDRPQVNPLKDKVAKDNPQK